jgi:aminoglycoside phosphotransferase (APT) family kinase protein
MQPTNRQLLVAVRSGLRTLAREAGSSSALIAQLEIAVGELLERASGRAESLRTTYAEARMLALRGAALLDQIGDGRVYDRACSLQAHAGADLHLVESSYRNAREVLTACVLSLGAVRSGVELPPAWSAERRLFYFDLASLEADRATKDIAPAPADIGQNTVAADFERLKSYFLRWPGRMGALNLLSVQTLSGGFSRQTFKAEVRSVSGDLISVILRKQLAGGLLGSSCLDVAGEVPFLKLAHAAGLPVTEVFDHETDDSILGGEFMVMSCLPGTTLGSSISPSLPFGNSLLRGMAELLARLHQIDWSAESATLCALSGLQQADRINARDAADSVCRAFEVMWREANLDPMPVLELILDWLKRNVPTTSRMAMISHGDIGLHNLMGMDGHITGLIDWETARLADPAKDVAMVRSFVSRHIPWERFMNWYRDAGGPEIDEPSLVYYSIYHAFTHLLVCEIAIGARFAQSDEPALEYLQLGRPVRAFFAQEMLRDCVPIWKQPQWGRSP